MHKRSKSRRENAERCPASLAFVLTLSLSTTSGLHFVFDASAQTLNLGPGATMPDGPRYALRREIDRLERETKSDDPGKASDEAEQLRGRFRAFTLAVLKKAAELDRSGESHVIAGFTLTRATSDFDRLVTLSRTWDEPARKQFDKAVLDLPTHTNDVPSDTTAFDEFLSRHIRRVVLSQPNSNTLASVPGWYRDPSQLEAVIRPTPAGHPAPTPTTAPPKDTDPPTEMIASVTRAIASLQASAAKPGASPWLAARLESVILARRVLDPLPTWIAPAKQVRWRERVASEIQSACSAQLDGSFSTEPLCRAAAVAVLIAHIDSRKEISPRISRDMRETILQLIGGEREKQPLPQEHHAGVIIAILRVLNVTAPPTPGSPDEIRENAIVREARPMLRLLIRESDSAAENAISACLTAARRGASASDPAVLSALNAHKSLIENTHRLVRLSAWLEDPTADPSSKSPPRIADDPAKKRIATRMLKLGQAMSKRDQQTAARAAIRSLDELTGAPLQDDPVLILRNAATDPDAASDWDAVTRSRRDDLLTSIESIRAELARAFGDHEGDPLDITRLQPLTESLSLARSIVSMLRGAVHAAALSRTADTTSSNTTNQAPMPGVQHWPGWELTPAAIAAMIDGAPPLLADACDAFLSRDNQKARTLLDRFGREYAFVRLLHELDTQAASRGITSSSALAELSSPIVAFNEPISAALLGTPWLIEQRSDLARIAWLAAEYHAARLEADRPGSKRTETLNKAAAIRAYVNQLSRDLYPNVVSLRSSKHAWCPQVPPSEPMPAAGP